MRRLPVLMAGLLAMTGVVRAESCATLEACLARFPVIATAGPGIGPEETALAEAVQRFGAQAIPHLIKLLESERENVRTLAGYTLRDVEGLTAEHLPALIKARKNGDGWIPPAIARVGTPEAVEFLVSDLREDPETHTQVTVALRILGAKAAPVVAELLRCSENCIDRVQWAAIFVLTEMKDDAAGALPVLLEIAGDAGLALNSRRSAITAIGSIGDSAQPLVPQLIALGKQAPDLESAVDAALASMGAAEAVPSLLQALPVDPEQTLKEIAGLGNNGNSAGPFVLKYLEDRRWDVRIRAASALGHIGYEAAEPALRKALTDADDWKLVFAAAIALGRLGSDASVEPLARVRDEHWYPPVRDIAAAAIRHIETGADLVEPDWWAFSSLESSPKSCSSVEASRVDEAPGQKLYARHHKRKLKRLAYPSEIRSYGPPEDAVPDKNGITTVTQENMVEHVEKIRQVPTVALKITDGWLVGANRGEWGGELVHIPAKGPSNVLFDENIEDIFLLGDRLVATSGLAHLGLNGGVLMRIDKNDSGRYVAAPWKRLPAAPMTSWVIEGGGLLVNTYGGGSVIIDSSGTLRMAECLTVVETQ
jgi:HEAT repeat protein